MAEILFIKRSCLYASLDSRGKRFAVQFLDKRPGVLTPQLSRRELHWRANVSHIVPTLHTRSFEGYPAGRVHLAARVGSIHPLQRLSSMTGVKPADNHGLHTPTQSPVFIFSKTGHRIATGWNSVIAGEIEWVTKHRLTAKGGASIAAEVSGVWSHDYRAPTQLRR